MRALVLSVLMLMLVQPVSAYAAEATEVTSKLWEKYSQMLVDQLDIQRPGLDPDKSLFLPVPDDQLDRLEGEFADTSAYWELRYWNAVAAAGVVNDATAVEWLRKGRTFLDFHGRWFLYRAEILAEDDNLTERHKLTTDFAAERPEESWPHYELAFIEFELGNWELGLSHLEAGNSAKLNRAPMLFPWSEVWANFGEAGESNRIAAGAVYDMQVSMFSLPNYVRKKAQAKQQVERWRAGKPLAEFAPWHHYVCRSGMAPGNQAIDQLVSIVYEHILTTYLLTEAVERLSVDQRAALLRSRDRVGMIKGVFRERPFVDAGADSILAGLANMDRGFAHWFYKMVRQEHETITSAQDYWRKLEGNFDPLKFEWKPSLAEPNEGKAADPSEEQH